MTLNTLLRACLKFHSKSDEIIAAHVCPLNAVLVTDNTRQFHRISHLPLENWLREGQSH